MSKFTSSFPFETEFDGDKVFCKLRRLKRKHVAKLSPFMVAAESGEMKIRFTDQMQLLEALETILPECIDGDLNGLRDADGNALKLAQIVDDIYFMPLYQQMMSALLHNSFLKVEDEKKSVAPPPAG